MKVLWKLSLLIGLTVLCFSCKDDDDDPSLQDSNPIYFYTDKEFELGSAGSVESYQFSFDHQKETLRLVAQVVPTVAATGVDSYVYDVTLNLSEVNKSDDYKYSIVANTGSTYTQNLKANSIAASCTDFKPDPDYGLGTTSKDASITNFVVWDASQGKYYISTASVFAFMFGLIDPGFSIPATDPGYGNLPNLYQSTGSIKECSELPTTFN
ncbi:hypothetical protein EI427_05980 [Flammeovirga pectinis]|uniref:Uncharacterized protein n=1 Tax=Flammeovirga pectinis TaxID=2494373 RepID=A0A3S9P0S8_9BACT|nr:hypothetical protein [Flammeovirga pectinis]AZQ61799.1 hypothetical protein EI427_05980 [Flammeovirga pectinis]